MYINEAERDTSRCLIKTFIKKKASLPYINIGGKNEYLGWVSDFHLRDINNRKIYLDLRQENDLFLLFVLALSWSRTGPWENAAFLVAYLKLHNKDQFQFWGNKENSDKEKENRVRSAASIVNELYGISPRKKVSFRKDIFDSINLLAVNWERIKSAIDLSAKNRDFMLLIKFLRNLTGLGVCNRRILIKIPLILREMRCQNVSSVILGDICCVPDARVLKAGKDLNLTFPNVIDLDSLLKCSSKIYNLFGDLYDLPLFAYEDLKSNYELI